MAAALAVGQSAGIGSDASGPTAKKGRRQTLTAFPDLESRRELNHLENY
jgi:hypothetical protein